MALSLVQRLGQRPPNLRQRSLLLAADRPFAMLPFHRQQRRWGLATLATLAPGQRRLQWCGSGRRPLRAPAPAGGRCGEEAPPQCARARWGIVGSCAR